MALFSVVRNLPETSRCTCGLTEGRSVQMGMAGMALSGNPPHPPPFLPHSTPSENFPDALNCAQVEIYSHQKCEEAYPEEVTEGMVCAVDSNGADSCQVNDSLINQFKLLLN